MYVCMDVRVHGYTYVHMQGMHTQAGMDPHDRRKNWKEVMKEKD